MADTCTWSGPREPNPDIGYNHEIMETPFGRILITWKGWKEEHLLSYSVDEFPGGGYCPCGGDLVSLKEACEEELKRRLVACCVALGLI